MSAVLASRPSVANKVDLLESLPGRPSEVADLEATHRVDVPSEKKYSYPSAKIAIIAGTVGIVALPVISAIALIPAAIATIVSAAAYGINYALGGDLSAETAKIYFLVAKTILSFSVIGLIPGASIAATAIYLEYTEKSPDTENRRFLGSDNLFVP